MVKHIIQEIMKKMGEEDRKALAIAFPERNLGNLKGIHIDYIEDLSEDVDTCNYDSIILGKLSNKELASIALGTPNDLISSIVIEGILTGKKVYVLADGVAYYKYKETSNIAFYNMLQEYERKLKLFGIEFVEKGELLNLFQENEDRNQSKAYFVQEKIITEAVIKGVFMNGYQRITTKKDAIFTPLARDYIRTNQIQIHNQT